MTGKRQWIPAAGLVVIAAVSIYMVAQLRAQTVTGDFSNAAVAEVREAQGQIILRGQFVAEPDDADDDDVERKAVLQPTGIDVDASGVAEVEIDKSTPARQEIELTLENVTPGAVFTLVIDGREVATATANAKGRGEIEVDSRK